MSYQKGQLIRCEGAFTDPDTGAYLDPTAVFFQFETPNGTQTTYTYGVHAQVVKTATGRYYVNINAATAGSYWYRFYSTGTGQDSRQKDFAVGAGRF